MKLLEPSITRMDLEIVFALKLQVAKTDQLDPTKAP